MSKLSLDSFGQISRLRLLPDQNVLSFEKLYTYDYSCNDISILPAICLCEYQMLHNALLVLPFLRVKNSSFQGSLRLLCTCISAGSGILVAFFLPDGSD